MDTTAYIKKHRRPVVRPPTWCDCPTPVQSSRERHHPHPHRLPRGTRRGARADRQQPSRSSTANWNTNCAPSHPRIAMFYMDSDSSSPRVAGVPRGGRPRRGSPSRDPPREFFDGRNYCWGEPVTRTHVPTGKIRVEGA
jgi:hypothetical protein